MIRVTVEIVPYGQEDLAQTVKTIYIANDGTGTHERGNYSVWDGVDPRDIAKPVHDSRHAGLRDFKRADGVLRCVERCLYKLRRGERA